MFTFILSVIVVSIICLCFFKKDFWENRYLVLLISGCVALVATLTINFSVRGKLQTKTEVMWDSKLAVFYMPKDLLVANYDSVHGKLNSIKHYDWYSDHKAEEFYKEKDTVKAKKQVPVSIVLYTWGKKLNNHRIGTMSVKGRQTGYDLDEVYLMKSTADTIAYVSRKKLYYDVKPNNWITGFSLPCKSVITIIHIPPTEFALIPDSLIRPIPF